MTFKFLRNQNIDDVHSQIILQLPMGWNQFKSFFPETLVEGLGTEVMVLIEMSLIFIHDYQSATKEQRFDVFYDKLMGEYEDWIDPNRLRIHGDALFQSTLRFLGYISHYTSPDFIPQLQVYDYMVKLHRFNPHFVQIGIDAY